MAPLPTNDHRGPTTEQVARVVEDAVGGRVVTVRRQTRWRPTWFVDLERDGRQAKFVVRGDRVDSQAYPLKHELAFHSLLESNGIAVPRLYGYLGDIDAVLMDYVPGRPDFAGVPDPERDVVVDEYLQQLVRIHALPTCPFVEAGIFHPAESVDSGMAHRNRIIQMWRAKKRQPDPFMEFCLGWLRRHPALGRGRLAPVLGDTGQFHHHEGHLQTILDLEFGHVGDPMLDLAQWRMRDTIIPYGDFAKLYARYEELSGTEVDLEAIKLHRFASTLGNQLMFGPAIVDPAHGSDLMTNIHWTSETNLHATEALAEYLDVELPTVEAPIPRRTRHDQAYRHLVRSLTVSTEDDLLRHELRLTFRMARHLQRAHQIGDALEEANLDDLQRLFGYRPASWEEGDAALEEFVLADAERGDHDVTLLRLLHKRNLRKHMQLGPEGSTMVTHHPMKPIES